MFRLHYFFKFPSKIAKFGPRCALHSLGPKNVHHVKSREDGASLAHSQEGAKEARGWIEGIIGGEQSKRPCTGRLNGFVYTISSNSPIKSRILALVARCVTHTNKMCITPRTVRVARPGGRKSGMGLDRWIMDLWIDCGEEGAQPPKAFGFRIVRVVRGFCRSLTVAALFGSPCVRRCQAVF